MKRGIWLVVSFLMALSLVLASCAPAAPVPQTPAPITPTPTVPTPTTPTPTTPTAPAGPEMVKLTFTKMDGTTVERSLEKPRYGGVITIATDRNVPSYDPTVSRQHVASSFPESDTLFVPDHMRGPAGTGETDWLYSFEIPAFSHPQIATGYELPDKETITLHIRQGVRYISKPPVNGREVTSADVVHSIKYNFNMDPEYPAPKSQYVASLTSEARPISVTAPDKWTVVVKVNPVGQGDLVRHLLRSQLVFAPEITPKAGQTWKSDTNISNGPWILKDVVPGVSWSYIRNPDYWQRDYAFPENQLPYADGYKALLVSDVSTLLAAVRTGKSDMLREGTREQGEQLLKDSPEMKVALKLGETTALYYRIDKPELPWSNLKVRQALQMAIDREAIKRDLYAGQADIYAWPIQDRTEMRSLGAFMPMEELPANIQELFQYKPDKAKQLLAEAGYPNGFSMEVTTMNQSNWVDQVSILQFYLEKIGVNLKIDVKERGVFESMAAGFTHKEGMFERLRMSPAYQGFQLLPGEQRNFSMVDDPVLAEARREFSSNYVVVDDKKAFAAFRKATPHVLEQSWFIAMPTPMESMLWWPWLKRFDGINEMGNSRYGWVNWAWVDQKLKKSMGY